MGRLLLVVLFLLIVIPCRSQIFVGPVAGLNYSWIGFSEKQQIYNSRPVWGYHAGANVSIKVRNRFFLHSSVIYSQKGKKLTNDLDPLYYHEVRYNYIEIPLVYSVDFKSTFGRNRVFKWFLGAGPNISYWLGGKGDLSSSNIKELGVDVLHYRIVFRKDPEDISDSEMTVREPNRMQLGLNVATGFVLEPEERRKITLHIRYEMGHSFLSRTSDGMFATIFERDDMKSQNRGLRVSLSYAIDLQVETRKKGKSTIKRRNVR
jgi:hypothetical protein